MQGSQCRIDLHFSGNSPRTHKVGAQIGEMKSGVHSQERLGTGSLATADFGTDLRLSRQKQIGGGK